MKRETAVVIVWVGCLVGHIATTTAAPVPKHLQKDARPTKLTKELLHGKWGYEWSGSLNGWIEFDAKSGTYTSQHQPDSDTIYSGSFAVSDGSITLTEWSFNVQTGAGSGPHCYRFDLGFGDWPAISGKSTGSFGFDVQEIPTANIPCKLRDRK